MSKLSEALDILMKQEPRPMLTRETLKKQLKEWLEEVENDIEVAQFEMNRLAKQRATLVEAILVLEEDR